MPSCRLVPSSCATVLCRYRIRGRRIAFYHVLLIWINLLFSIAFMYILYTKWLERILYSFISTSMIHCCHEYLAHGIPQYCIRCMISIYLIRFAVRIHPTIPHDMRHINLFTHIWFKCAPWYTAYLLYSPFRVKIDKEIAVWIHILLYLTAFHFGLIVTSKEGIAAGIRYRKRNRLPTDRIENSL